MLLRDLGERRILQEIVEGWFPDVPDSFVPVGDDAAAIAVPNASDALVLTTDPCPTPVAWLLGERDHYLFGWFSILINASDLAAMGAAPAGALLAVNAREDMKVDDFKRFLTGASAAAREFKCPVLGGNLKDAQEFSCVGTAVGFIDPDLLLTRSGSRAGDLVAVIGEMGLFASGVLAKLRNLQLRGKNKERAEKNLLRPRALVDEGQLLSSGRLATSCMDSSDGLANCFYQIASKSKVDLYIDLDQVTREPVVDLVADELGLDPRKLMLMWGDWQLVCTVPRSKKQSFETALKTMGTHYSFVGEVKSGDGNVFLRDGVEHTQLHRIDSERFSSSSYFSHELHEAFDLWSMPLFTTSP